MLELSDNRMMSQPRISLHLQTFKLLLRLLLLLHLLVGSRMIDRNSIQVLASLKLFLLKEFSRRLFSLRLAGLFGLLFNWICRCCLLSLLEQVGRRFVTTSRVRVDNSEPGFTLELSSPIICIASPLKASPFDNFSVVNGSNF